MKFSIRQATPTDSPTLSHIELATSLQLHAHLREAERAALQPRLWRNWLQNTPPFHHPQTLRKGFVAYDWNMIYGFSAVRHQSNYAGYSADVAAICVLPRWQRKGIGRALFVQTAKWLMIDQIHAATVECLTRGPALEFFSRLGGRVIDRWTSEEEWVTIGFNNLREITEAAEAEL